MRLVVAVGLVVSALAVPASAAPGVDPAKLVLQDVDVPRPFVSESSNSGLLRGTTPEARREAARVGYVTGYYVTFRDTSPPHWRTIRSSAFVLTAATRAREWLRRALRNSRRQLAAGDRVTRAAVGDEGWLLTSGEATGVLWRQGRVVAAVTCEKVRRHRAVATALARTQQRRIVAALG